MTQDATVQNAVLTVLFYVIASGMTVFALIVVFTRKLLHAAVSLMTVLMLTAGVYILLRAEFLAGVQVLVYIGGIVVLIVFAIMLTRTADLLEDHPTRNRMLMGSAAGLGMLFMSCCVFFAPRPAAAPQLAAPIDDVREIGTRLLDYTGTGYVLPFEIISLLLLAAALGGIVIARKIPAPEQPFTSGGDLDGEVHFTKPRTQREETAS